jgi:outer membrane murein-binding lipoprotein Lpp
MDNLTLEEAKQIITFYIKKASDLEMNVLTGQIKNNNLSAEVNNLKSQISSLSQKIQSLDSQIVPAKEVKATKTKK